ncbi:peptidase domain-containing ABC transporter [Dyadobacter sp. CY345]|uniref:peptidase domain-containing ABC transporter n=1 Tax=Dyadobacter sp. CY345 TaxID=2909335 RepID=UPI00210767C3|nr:peptidase domain-containing ABC transporter [Dyadobacter sp. CY345]
MSRKYPFYRQYDRMDCGPTCIRMISKFYGKSFDGAYLRELTSLRGDGTTMGGLVDAAENIGFSTLVLTSDYKTLAEQIPLPCIAHWRQRHYVVVYEATATKVVVADPGHGLITYSRQDFLKGWIPEKSANEDSEGILLLFETTPAFFSQEGNQISSKSVKGFLAPYFRPYQRHIWQLFLGLFLTSLLQLGLPFLTQEIVDTGINTRNLNFVTLVLVAQLVLFISQSGLSVIRNWILLHVTSRINLRMLSDFLMKLMNLPISFFESKSTGDIMQRIQDHNRVQAFLSATTLDVLFSTVTLTIFGAILYYFNPQLFLVFIIGSALYMAWVLLFMKKRAKIDYQYFDQSSGNQSSTIQLINGMQEIKLNGSEKRRRWEWEAIQARLFKLNMASLSLSQSQNEGGRFINEVKNILISYIAARSVINGELTLGAMLSVQYIIGQMNVPVNNFIAFIRSYQDAKLSLERLAEIHNKTNEENVEELLISELPEDKTIQVSGLNFRYGSSTSALVLNNINFQIPQGKVTAIVGASGSGKTTLLKLLLKYHDLTDGKIEIGNGNLKNLSYNFWRKQCGVVMQEGYIFADSVARNISESDENGGVNRKKLAHSVHVANIGDFVEELPNGYNTRIGSSGMGISGGQKQRILIARAVYKDPEYIFFDEATSALDANNEAVIMRNLEAFFTGKTVVVVAHRLSTVKNADQIIVLDKGSIIEKGTHVALVQSKGYYYSLVKNQLELGS